MAAVTSFPADGWGGPYEPSQGVPSSSALLSRPGTEDPCRGVRALGLRQRGEISGGLKSESGGDIREPSG